MVCAGLGLVFVAGCGGAELGQAPPRQSELLRLSGLTMPAVSADYCTWARFAFDYGGEAGQIVNGREDLTGEYIADLRSFTAVLSSKVPAELADTVDVLQEAMEVRFNAFERGERLSDAEEEAIHTMEFERAEDRRVGYWREVCGVPL